MEPNNPNPLSQTPISPPTHEEDKSVGPAIGVVLIVLIIVLGGLYFWGQRVSQQQQAQTAQTGTTTGY
jgi:uncharacterized protein HemX